MLFEALLHDGTATLRSSEAGYNVEQLHISFGGPIDVGVLERAWALVLRRHPVLTSAFAWEGLEHPQQETHPDAVLRVARCELAHDLEPERGHELARWLREDRSRGFDLRAAPLMRLCLLRSSPERSELVWTFHHVLLDGRSFPLVLRDVFLAYAALAREEEPRFPPAPRPYSDFLEWLKTIDHAASHAYFRELLQGKLTPTPLPAAEPLLHPLPADGYGTQSSKLPNPVFSAVQNLARATETTTSTVLQAAWTLVLSRFTRDQDVVFGSTRACRRSALDGNTLEMVGLFMNTLPIRARLSDERTVRDLLLDLRAQSLALREHEHTPLVEIHKQSSMPRGTPLFETLLMFESQELNSSLRKLNAPEWHSLECERHEQPSLPLNITVIEENHLEVRILFNRQRFTEAAISRLLTSLCVSLRELSRDPERKLGELDVLPSDERLKILGEWNRTEATFPDSSCIHQLFEQRVLTQPDASAVECEGQALSYRELETRSNRLSHVLRKSGARPGVYVGVCLERGIELIVALLAISKSGAAYLPLDPDYPRDRIAFMLEDARAIFVVTEERYAALFQCVVLFIEDVVKAKSFSDEPSSPPALEARSSDVCYAIFTSGSTGRPKGVVLTHRAVVNTLDWVTRTLAIGPGDRLLFVTSPCFDLSVYDTFGALGAGATVVVATTEQIHDPERLARTINEHTITIWNSAPAALQCLIPYLGAPKAGAGLRLVMLSGDWIPVGLPDAVRNVFAAAAVVSLGGATEAAIWSNWFPIGQIDPRWASIPYGKPIQNARYHVLDHRLEPVPIGVPGDLYIGGACLAAGYLHREELTRERFIPDPFHEGTCERLYKTGDLARYFEDGNLEFLGRADAQVKIRGFRVELGEVEVLLSQIAGVQDAACSTFIDASGQAALIAYVVPHAGVTLDEAGLKRELARKLPSFMVPSHVILLPELPLSENGKLDRKALPAPSARTRTSKNRPPKTDIERGLAEIWSRLLNVTPIGMTDNFFDLGGHSLLAVMLMSELKITLKRDIPLSRIISCPTIESLSLSLSDDAASSANSTQGASGEPLIQTLRQGGSKSLFLIHDGDGETLLYFTLAQRISRQFSVYGIRPKALPGIPMVHLDLTEMARCYLNEVKRQQPKGPYYLGGLCAGGVIAFEIASQLEQGGDGVELVALLDAVQPTLPKKRFRVAARRFQRLERLWRTRRHADEGASSLTDAASEPPLQVSALLGALLRKVKNALAYEMGARLKALGVGLRMGLLRRILTRDGHWPRSLSSLTARDIYLVASRSYVPKSTHIKHVLLIAGTQGTGKDEPVSAQANDPFLGWQPYVQGELRLIQVAGGHSSMLQEPCVNEVARTLAEFLDAEVNGRLTLDQPTDLPEGSVVPLEISED